MPEADHGFRSPRRVAQVDVDAAEVAVCGLGGRSGIGRTSRGDPAKDVRPRLAAIGAQVDVEHCLAVVVELGERVEVEPDRPRSTTQLDHGAPEIVGHAAPGRVLARRGVGVGDDELSFRRGPVRPRRRRPTARIEHRPRRGLDGVVHIDDLPAARARELEVVEVAFEVIEEVLGRSRLEVREEQDGDKDSECAERSQEIHAMS